MLVASPTPGEVLRRLDEIEAQQAAPPAATTPAAPPAAEPAAPAAPATAPAAASAPSAQPSAPAAAPAPSARAVTADLHDHMCGAWHRGTRFALEP